jgi:hypothetical protein
MRFDDDELNIRAEVAASLGYAPERPRRRAVAPGPAAPRRPGPDVGAAIGGIITVIFGIFVGFVLLSVICFVITAARGPASPTTAAGMSARPQITHSAPSTSQVPPHQIASPAAPEPQVVDASSEETPQPRAAEQPSTEGTISIAPPFSYWQWVCVPKSGQMLCGLRDGNGKYVQSFSSDGYSVQASEIFADAFRPPSLGCGVTKGNLHCTIQDGQGHILQGCIYDGHSVDCGNSDPPLSTSQEEAIPGEPGEVAEDATGPIAYLPSEYDVGCVQGAPRLRFIWLHDRMPRGFGPWDRLTPLPVGTCVLFERENANGWRRVVSFDGVYRGYAQVFPTSGERPRMHPLYTKLIPLIRGIP